MYRYRHFETEANFEIHVSFRPWQNNCLVPVTYGPESRVGRSGKYFILDKNFMSPIINLPGKMTSAKFRSLTSHTHTHTADNTLYRIWASMVRCFLPVFITFRIKIYM